MYVVVIYQNPVHDFDSHLFFPARRFLHWSTHVIGFNQKILISRICYRFKYVPDKISKANIDKVSFTKLDIYQILISPPRITTEKTHISIMKYAAGSHLLLSEF